MDATLRWQGGLPEMLALDRLLRDGIRPRLVHAPDPVVPDFLVAEQAAALGLDLEVDKAAPAPPLAAPPVESATPWRAFVCACAPPLTEDDLGKFVDEAFLALLPARAPMRTFVTEGPHFARRVEIMADDIIPFERGWRLGIGLRGC